MEGTTGSGSIDKLWDHAWSTEEMRKNRRDWSLAGDSGLLKHLQQFSENLTKKANETQEAINSMTSQLNEAAILVDNITNTSLALANTQFIESRVQEDNIEIEQPVEDTNKNENNHEFSATDLLVSVCESIKQGLSIMDEKYEKVEVVASDSEDEDDNAVPSVILRPKDPYQDRPLPYVIGTEQWKASTKIGLESSSSESEQNDEDEDSVSDTDNKNVGNMLNSNIRTNSGIGSRLSSTSSESNDYNVESSSIKDTDHSRLHARSQDTLNSDTEPTTPSSILPKTQNVNNGLPSFAEELAKRLGNVMPSQKNTITRDTNEQIINRSKDDIFSPEDEQDVFSNKSDNLFSEGKNLFSDEGSSTSWKNKPVRPVNKTIIPPSIDVPPPLSIISSAPKSNIDDLFGDAEDSEDSDDIFSKKSSKDIFASEREAVRSEIVNKQKNLHIENVQNTSTMTTSTPETNDRGKGLFEDEDDEDLFGSTSKQVKTPDAPSVGSVKKKPVGGVSILGQVDIRQSSKFARRPSSSSSSASDSTEQPQQQSQQRIDSSNNNSSDRPNADSGAHGSSPVAGNNSAAAGNATVSSTDNSSSGISMHQPSIDNTASSGLGADFQPLMSSSRLKSEEIYRERVASDSLFNSRSRTSNNSNDQQQQQQQRPAQQQQAPAEDVSEHEDVFGPPPLPKASENTRPKSKVNSLFDDSDSGDDLFASASPGSRSLKSSEPTPSKAAPPQPQQQQQQSKRLSLFDDDDDLFGPPRDAPDVDLFAAKPVKNLVKATDGLFDDVDEAAGLFAADEKTSKQQDSVGLFADKPPPLTKALFAEKSEKKKEQPASGDSLFGEKSERPGLFKEPARPADKPSETKKSGPKGLFDEDDSGLFSKPSKPAEPEKSGSSFSGSSKSLFEDTSDSDLFGSSASKNVLDKNIPTEKSSDSLFSGSKESTGLFGTKESAKNLFEEKATRPKKLTTSIFDDSDDDDLFGGSSLTKKKAASSVFEDGKIVGIGMEDEKKPEDEPVSSKPAEKSSIFEDDDDDDLFGDKKKSSAKEEASSDREKSAEEPKKEENKTEPKTKPKTEPGTKPEVAPKKAILAEIRQKLEKHKLLDAGAERPVKPAAAAEPASVVDGAVSSKKEPPKSLKIQLPMPMPQETTSNGDKQSAVPKKPLVSGKIKNLMGKMGDLKILSPTDTPPLFRKNASEDKSSNEDEQEPLTADSGASSEASTPASTPASLPSGGSSPQNSGTNSRARDSPSLKSDNTEVAISFDEPAQVETLATASKSRARIPAKRRPQSRQARHSALRHSGIDFDVIDAATSPSQLNGDASDAVDRLLPSGRSHEAGHSADNDRSELSASRNTTTNLLSPSTDEEDLFDVPPDLPEDPAAKEDSLFGRAPILSPIETIDKPAKKPETVKKENAERKTEDRIEEKKKENEKEDEEDEESKECEDKKAVPIDPLRDQSHDPLKDPSQLFAFVTKTPSPEKNKGLILSEDDDSLFSSSSKPVEKPIDAKPKPTLDLFDDDDDTGGNDLFSSGKSKLKKKPLKDTKIDLFEDVTPEDDDDSLFGPTTKKSKDTTSNAPSVVAKVEEKLEPKNTKTATKDIFNDSSDDEDIFAGSKKAIPKKTSKSLFDDEEDDDDGDIFGKPKSSLLKDSKTATDNGRPVVKKAVTRDLKKTAEKIVEDPLSMLQDD